MVANCVHSTLHFDRNPGCTTNRQTRADDGLRGPVSRRATGIRVLLVLCLIGSAGAARAEALSPTAAAQIQALMDEKASRTPAQLKIDSQLLYALKLARRDVSLRAVPSLSTGVTVDASGNTSVDIRATDSVPVLAFLKGLGATVESSYPHDVRAGVPLGQVEQLAALAEVIFVKPASVAYTNKTNTSEGDVTHRAAAARTAFGFDGTGVKVCAMSNGVDSRAALQGTGDLPAGLTVLPGQAGSGDEGSAMLKIVYDLAPGASLYFAKGGNGTAGMAANILSLSSTYGCDIFVDDVFFTEETPFQDGQAPSVTSNSNGGAIIQAINTVVSAGALFFTSAGNAGGKDKGTSGTWEGDFASAGASSSPVPAGTLHAFGGGQAYDVLTSSGNVKVVDLFWADPLGGSGNDYDLFVLDSTGATVLFSSTNPQTGSQDPWEEIYLGATPPTSPRIVVLQKAGAAGRFLHVDTNRGTLSISTQGATHGHSAPKHGYGVAATPANSPGPYPNPFNSSNHIENFSSDGPRRIFFNADSTQVNPGSGFLATGGQLLQKPDVTAADGVSCMPASFNPFYGTSAAAPHAAAIAALVKSVNPSFTAGQIDTALRNSAIDIEQAGWDRNSGTGIVMAYQAIVAADPCVFSCPGDISVPAPAGQCSATVSWPAITTSGACGTMTISPPSGSVFALGTTPVVVQAASGAQCTFHVTVNDVTPPNLTCPGNIVVDGDHSGGVVNYPPAVAVDACSAVTIGYSTPSGAHFPVGATTVTVTATDASLNTSTCTFMVYVAPLVPGLSPLGLAILAFLVALAGLLTLRAGPPGSE